MWENYVYSRNLEIYIFFGINIILNKTFALHLYRIRSIDRRSML